ncbi:hypothetical protein GQ457_01G026790 [Hibiscus cannabinus]
MLQTALCYKDVFLRCVQLHRDRLYKYLPTEDDWTFTAEICEKFSLFYEYWSKVNGIISVATLLDPCWSITLKIFMGLLLNSKLKELCNYVRI